MDSYDRSVALLRFCRRHHKLTTTLTRKNGLTAGQPPILHYLHEHAGCIQNELSKSCHLEPATITSILGTMERDGLIERRADPSDRRVWQIYLTDAGQNAYETLRNINAAIGDLCFEGMTQEEIDTFLSLLERMLENIRKKLGAEGACCCEERKNNT